MPEIIGIDHIYISVSDMSKSTEFYDLVMAILGFKKSSFCINNKEHVQYFNKHFGYVLRPSKGENIYDSNSTGMHHFCFRTEAIEDVQEIATSLFSKGIKASEPRFYPEYAADYFAIYFSDPDGMILEITNYRKERKDRYQNWN